MVGKVVCKASNTARQHLHAQGRLIGLIRVNVAKLLAHWELDRR